MIKIYLLNKNGTHDITDFVTDVNWSGDYEQASRILEFGLAMFKEDVQCGNAVAMDFEGTRLFDGYIETRTKDSMGIYNVKAVDGGFYVNRNKVSYKFTDTTPESITRKICGEFSISVGSIPNTYTSISRNYINKSIYECIMDAFTQASYSTGKKYMIVFKDHKLNIIEKGTVNFKYVLDEDINVIDANYSETISKMVNRVLVYDSDNVNLIAKLENNADIQDFGLLQEIMTAQRDKDYNKEANNMMQSLEYKVSIECLGHKELTTGYSCLVRVPTSDMVGKFYIESDQHTFNDGKYTTRLTINFENLMDEKDIGDLESDSNSFGGSSSSNGGGVLNGKEVNAEFTAYYPSNDPMQGGFKDAMGNTLDPNKLTCACPKEIPFNTQIQVLNTNTDRDGLTYTCTDRGGAIKVVNGVYKIDLLMKDRTTAYAFGRRKGKIIIGNGSGYSGGGATGKAGAVVATAKSKLGCKYVWGATGPNQFDCSGLMQWSYKQQGISITRTTYTQIKDGRAVNRNELQPGDLVFFNNLAHVGMYIGDNKFIHAPNSRRPVSIDKLEGYYSNTYYGARRIL